MRVTGTLAQRAASRIPVGARRSLRAGQRRLTRWATRRRPLRSGGLRRLEPLSDVYGIDRGTPIDRVFIDNFAAQNRASIRGRVLEVGDGRMAKRFGAAHVTEVEVLDVDPANPLATIVVDLDDQGALDGEAFDCVVLTQVLQFLRRPDVALHSIWEALNVHGTILITVPCVSRRDATSGDSDFWRWTPAGLALLLEQVLPGAKTETVAFGNLLTCVAFLHGLAGEELRATDLAHVDEDFPLLACARVTRPA